MGLGHGQADSQSRLGEKVGAMRASGESVLSRQHVCRGLGLKGGFEEIQDAREAGTQGLEKGVSSPQGHKVISSRLWETCSPL